MEYQRGTILLMEQPQELLIEGRDRNEGHWKYWRLYVICDAIIFDDS